MENKINIIVFLLFLIIALGIGAIIPPLLALIVIVVLLMIIVVLAILRNKWRVEIEVY